jgi:hypothetical protein
MAKTKTKYPEGWARPAFSDQHLYNLEKSQVGLVSNPDFSLLDQSTIDNRWEWNSGTCI